MLSIFDTIEWPHLRGSLHVYALPDQPVRARLEPAVAALQGIAGIAPVPDRWLHATVSRLPVFLDDVDPASVRDYNTALGQWVAGATPFEVDLRGPNVWDTGVAVAGNDIPLWVDLVGAVRGLSATIFGGDLPNKPARPHVSLAYGVDEVDDAPIRKALANFSFDETFRVDRIWVLSVDADPTAGTFTWDVIGDHRLG